MNCGAGSFLVLALLSVVSPVFGINCYVCNSREDPTCLDPYHVENSTHSVDCSKSDMFQQIPIVPLENITLPTACQKLVYNVPGGNLVERSCSLGKDACKAVERVTSKDSLKFCGVCTGDNCNCARRVFGALPLAFAAAWWSARLW